MRLRKRLKIITIYTVCITVVLIGVPLLQKIETEDIPFEKDTLLCIISTDRNSGQISYPIGYNYEMLERFAAHLGKQARIALGGKEYLDSLRNGSIDILVYPFCDTLISDKGFNVSTALADSSSWLTRGRDFQEHRTINIWLSHYFKTETYKQVESRFTPSYEPYRRAAINMKSRTLSPYDDLIRTYAAELGWEREMLTALIWQESRFRIEAQSRRGAVGLMQMMPHTAGSYNATDPLNPIDNISTGVRYLKHLQRMFRNETSGHEELMKFTLAAYNAGEGRLQDCIAYAASVGKPHSTWEDITAIIPEMRTDAILESDTVKLGKFKGYETIRYVEQVCELYGLFREISGRPLDTGGSVSDNE